MEGNTKTGNNYAAYGIITLIAVVLLFMVSTVPSQNGTDSSGNNTQNSVKKEYIAEPRTVQENESVAKRQLEAGGENALDTEPAPYSKDWFGYVLYSAKLSHKSAIWHIYLKLDNKKGEEVVKVRFQSVDSAYGIGDLIYQKVSEYPDEKFVLYADTALVSEDVIFFEIPANREVS